ncbi:MAG: hypothetical protein ACETV1_01570 [Candidatus Bathyarchaeia archaeon]
MKKWFLDSLKSLDGWLEANNCRGFDPYDLLGTKFYLAVSSVSIILRDSLKKDARRLTYPLRFPAIHSPKLMRRAFRIRPQHNAKAMALFARGYLYLYRRTGGKYLEKALKALEWLTKNHSRGYSGYCWGYPFDWMSRIFVPKETPSVVVSSIAANAFVDAYEILGDKKYLDVAESTCDFLLNDLNIDVVNEDMICFSYTPLDHFHVHNANLFGASLLARVYTHTKREEYSRLIEKAVRLATFFQNKDGSWYYWAPPDRLLYRIDNYHTGFNLEHLYVIKNVLKDKFRYCENLEKGAEYYRRNLFVKEAIPKSTPKSLYPIDIHNAAQGIITFSMLKKLNPQYAKVAENIAKWTIVNMQDEDGHFYYRIYRHRIDKMPYVRWGQAWMLYALARLIEIVSE